MGYYEYTPKKFQGKTLEVIRQADEILTEYAADGLTLTLRQLYYRFVASGLLPNTQANYDRLGAIIADARLAGLIDWDHIEDRTRGAKLPSAWGSPADILDSAASSYAEDLWFGQDVRPEVWVEKDALIQIVSKACEPYQVPFMSCRGYLSLSTMYEASQRLLQKERNGYTPIVIHLGDHDPSGVDMTRDNADRLELFTGGVEVRRIALTMDQVDEYQPPPNPTKFTDSRATGYAAKYGNDCWELDALEPHVMIELIQAEIQKVLRLDPWTEANEKQENNRDRLTELAEQERN